MKLLSKKTTSKKSPFVAINKTALQQVKGGAIIIVDIEDIPT